MTTYHLSSDRLAETDLSKMLSWDLNAEQFEAIQHRCSGNEIPSSWEGALSWADERSEFLYSQALSYIESGYPLGAARSEEMMDLKRDDICSMYAEDNDYCDYHVADAAVAYCTTRGTQFWIFREGGEQEGGETFHVALPVGRSGGNHHKSILLAIAGISNADRDRWEDTYKLPKGTPRETFEELWGEMKEVYDRILVPHGFPVMETYAESEARWAAMHQRNREWSEGLRDRLAEDYEDAPEFEDYEAYEDEEE